LLDDLPWTPEGVARLSAFAHLVGADREEDPADDLLVTTGTRDDALRPRSLARPPRGSGSRTAASRRGPELQLVRYPPRFGGGVRGSQVASDLDPAAVLDHAVARTRSWGEEKLVFWTNAADSPDLEDELRRRGAVHDDT
jgi:hypothetical protein